VKCFVRVFCLSTLCECSSEVLCASVLVKNSCECSSEVLCASVLVKYFVGVDSVVVIGA
jgi:hypothetical protein